MRGALLYSTCHQSVLTAPDGRTVNEHLVARLIAEGIRESLTPDLEMVDGSAPPRDNWRDLNLSAKRYKSSGIQPVIIECHVNSFPGPGAAHGLLLQHHKGCQEAHALCHILANRLTALIPPHRLVAIVEQPGPGSLDPPAPGYSRNAFFKNVNPPAVLIESGFVQDPAFFEWLQLRDNQIAIGHKIVAAVIEWLELLTPPTGGESIPFGGVIVG